MSLSCVALQDRPYLDHARRRGRAAGSPIKGRAEVGHVDQAEAAELLFGVGVGAVLHVPLAAIFPHGGAGIGTLKRSAAAHDAGLLQSLAISPPTGPVGTLPLPVAAGREVAVLFVDQDRILHVILPRAASVLRSAA